MLKDYMEVFLGIFSKSSQGTEAFVLVIGAILLITGIVNLFIRKFRVRGIFMIISALFYTVLFCLSLNIELDSSFMIAVCIFAIVVNVLDWFLGCGISFKALIKGIGGLILILAIGSNLLGVIGGMVKELLPESIPCLWQFLVLFFLFILDLAAFVGASVVKAGYSDSPSSFDDEDPVKWVTEDTQIVDTASMSASANSSDSDSGDIW